jgi:hypothetical protein
VVHMLDVAVRLRLCRLLEHLPAMYSLVLHGFILDRGCRQLSNSQWCSCLWKRFFVHQPQNVLTG